MVANNYTWSQEFDDISITVEHTSNINSSDVCVAVINDILEISINKEIIISDKLCKPVINDEIVWEIDGNILVVTLTKRVKEWWESAFEGHEKVDVSKIAETRNTSLNDLDSESRQMVEKMLYEQKCKATGEKTEEELRNEELMKKLNMSQFEGD
ncbi:putative nuclear movement protein NudC [Hamiltosporidium tvaerminnensis]|uniref:Putative nuclear movement protein NudC n=2 Tax=Hamiltosporidium TaxID=1176354 RepID=A0A4Q9L7T3_9MICR|nr:hypothetical protein LUQ84_000830 [Hamiltosporidium tvaerminnensis]TBU02768.1 putative nuclear movement protein NudC [Hamiltosporidium tvaerminnensis]TBU03277.1 putative nuclear movement protein NudC [Hamiltosporidium magnivora]TBU03717.1 putative nuclear movement protein NudC [Hamiltosporidium magnivora]